MSTPDLMAEALDERYRALLKKINVEKFYSERMKEYENELRKKGKP